MQKCTEEIRILFLPAAIQGVAQAGDTILDAALANGFALEHECGGNCACTTCHVHVKSDPGGISAMEAVEAERIAFADGLSPCSRLGCQAILLFGEVTVCAALRQVDGNEPSCSQ